MYTLIESFGSIYSSIASNLCNLVSQNKSLKIPNALTMVWFPAGMAMMKIFRNCVNHDLRIFCRNYEPKESSFK